MTDLAVLAAVVLVYAVASRRLAGTIVSAPMVFVGAGLLLGPDVLGVVELEPMRGTAFHVAEIALALVLFADAAGVPRRSLRGGGASLPVTGSASPPSRSGSARSPASSSVVPARGSSSARTSASS